MRLTIFNGSPKHGDNNTARMMDEFAKGFSSIDNNEFNIYKLNSFANIAEGVKLFEAADCIIIAFPLYVYSMPAGVKEFIEALEPLKHDGKCRKVGFLVQYGFHEAIHARPLERYLEQLAGMLNCEYVGTIIKGGCDGIAKAPDAKRNAMLLHGVNEIGRDFGENGMFNVQMLADFAKPEIQKKGSVFIMKCIAKMINKFYWSSELKKNGVLESSFNKPYGR